MTILYASRDKASSARLLDQLEELATTDHWHAVIGIDPEDDRPAHPRATYWVNPDPLYFTIHPHDDIRLFRPTWAINWLALVAEPTSHYWALNDDVELHCPGWDAAIMETPPGHLGLTDFSPAAGWHTNFPAFTYAHLKHFRTLFPWAFFGWGADHWISQTYALAGRARRLFLELDHHQADHKRQRLIQLFGPTPPTPQTQLQWIRDIRALK